MRIGLFVFCAFFFLPRQALCQPRKQALLRLMSKADIPGLQLVYLKGGKVTERYALGERSTDTKEPVDSSTVFAGCSLSKNLFAYAVLKLVDEGKLNLDRPLAQYADYPDAKGGEGYEKVTARQVLSHTAGLPNWRDSPALHFKYPPGRRFNYSGEGYVWLSHVVEKLVGQRIDSFISRTVLAPLDMTRSSYVWQPRFEGNFAYPHNDVGRTYKPNLPASPNVAYSLQTTAFDYSKFLLALLQRRGLKETTYRELVQPQPNSRTDTARNELFWGLGMGLVKREGQTALWQWGDNGTYKGFFIAHPGRQEALVYFANSNNGLAILRDVLQLFFGRSEPLVDWLRYPQHDEAPFQLLRRSLAMPFAEAIAPYLNTAKTHQDTVRLPEATMNDIGERLFQLKKFEAVRQLCAFNLKAYPRSGAAYEGLGMAALRLGNRQEASEAFTACYKLKPDRNDLKETAERLRGTVPVPNDTGLVKVTFRLPEYVDAGSVNLVGTFNNWNPITLPMAWTNGAWTAEMYLKPRTHSYKFVVDGVWLSDTRNPKVRTDNNFDSVLEVKR